MTLTIKINDREVELTHSVAMVYMQGCHDLEDVIHAIRPPSKMFQVLDDKSALARIKSELIEGCQKKYNYTAEEKEIYEAGVTQEIEIRSGSDLANLP